MNLITPHSSGATKSPSVPVAKDLIKPWKALKLLENYYGGSASAKEVIADKIADGEIQAYAKKSWEIRSGRWKVAIKNPPTNAVVRQRMRPGIFSGCRLLGDQARQWQWRKGHFCVKHSRTKKQNTIYLFRDVRFSRKQIDKLHLEAKEVAQAIYRGGRKPERDKWNLVTLELMRLTSAGRLVAGKSLPAESIFNELKASFETRDQEIPLGKSSLKKLLALIRDDFCNAPSNRLEG